MATEVIFLRVPPETKALLTATVEGMNKSRAMGDPEYTLTSLILSCVNQTLAPQPDAPSRKAPARKRSRK